MLVGWVLLGCVEPSNGWTARRADGWVRKDEDTATVDTGSDTGADTTQDSAGEDTGDSDSPPPELPARVAGFRASPYGVTPFPGAGYWEDVAEGMADRVPDAAPGGLWIVGVAGDDGTCYLTFPSPGGSWDDIGFSSEDANEDALDRFDAAGMRVWLQVEPGDADVAELITLVLDRYGHHPSVAGFGVDVEWFRWRNYEGGKAVTDDKAAEWRDAVRAYDPDHTLFLKHWLTDRMPPTERDGLLFIDDGQGVASLSELTAYFSEWGDTFAPAAVGYQFGYETDRSWWADLEDPPGEISAAILDAVPNTQGLYWVDFTVEDVFPP
jgi:hypothetical protein